MVNFGWNSASLLGIFLCVAGAGLYFVRTVRPELSRDYDIFFSAVGLVCGFILLFYGWRLEPILQFTQFLLAASTLFFAFETLRLRGMATEQAKRSTPIVDDDRPVSRSYQAYREPEYDELEPYEEQRYNRRQLRGTEYESEPRRSRKTRSSDPPTERGERRTRPSSRSSSSRRSGYSEADRYSDRYDEWEDDWDNPANPYNERRSTPPPRPSRTRRDPRNSDPRNSDPRTEEDYPPTTTSRRRRPRPESSRPSEPSRRSPTQGYEDEEPAPYVDYVDYSTVDEEDESISFEKEDNGNPTPDYRENFDRPEDSDYPEDYPEDDPEDYPEDEEDWTPPRRGDRFDY